MNFLEETKYPIRLLPKSNYKKIECSDELCPLFLTRHTPTKEFMMEGTNKINPDHLITPTNRMEDLSTNLLGEFLVEDNYIEIIGKDKNFHTEWNEGDKVIVPIYNEDFVINETRSCFFVKIENVISKHFTHTNIINNTMYNLIFNILHTPTRCNFWHFSIRVFVNETDISTSGIGDSVKKKLLRRAREELVECAVIETPDFGKLDSKYYQK